MNILEIKIKNIEEVSPKVSDFLSKGFDINYAQEISKCFSLRLKKEISATDDNEFDDIKFIYVFNECVDFSNFAVFGFNFTVHEEYEDFIHIGYLEADYLVLVKSTNEIAIMDYTTGMLIHLIAKKFEIFLDLIPILIEYDKIGYLGGKYTVDTKEIFIQKIKLILKSKKYFSFFNMRIGSNV